MRDPGPDRWRATGAIGAVVFFDMLHSSRLRPVRNVWGVSYPDVHKLKGTG